jgi:hypothetical protein
MIRFRRAPGKIAHEGAKRPGRVRRFPVRVFALSRVRFAAMFVRPHRRYP